MADPGRIRQVVTNLVGNAIKFTETGHVMLNVEGGFVDQDEDNVRLVFTVEDTGIGMNEEQAASIFKPFMQADLSTTRKFGGTGLGLSISRQLVEMMGGTLEVESVAGVGSTFSFSITVPVAEDVVVTDPGETANISGMNVLIVDDNAINRRIVCEYLESWGMIFNEAVDGEDAYLKAVEAAEAGSPYDIIVLDFAMPGSDGLETGVRMLADERLAGVKLLVLTSMGMRGDAKLFADAGFSAYLTKPVRASLLYNALVESTETVVVDHLITQHSLRKKEDENNIDASDINILVVEDNKVNQRVIGGVLGCYHAVPDVADNGQIALDMMNEKAYDLVFMDCSMPVMDGYEATRVYRESEGERHVLIVAMTAHAMQGARETCLDAGMDDYITKPINPVEVREILCRYFKPRRAVHTRQVQRVLIADSDDACLKSIHWRLVDMFPDAHVKNAKDGIQACMLLGSFMPEILILDLDMPFVDGPALIERLRSDARYRAMQIVALTTLGIKDPVVVRVKQLGANKVLRKPLSMNRFESCIRDVSNAHQAGWKMDDQAAQKPEEKVAAQADVSVEALVEPELVEPESLQVFNPAQLEKIFPGDTESQLEVLEAALESIEDLLDEYREALEEADLEEAERLAHSVKGAALNIGAERLASVAKQAEVAAAAEHAPEAEALQANLAAEMGQLQAVCEKKPE